MLLIFEIKFFRLIYNRQQFANLTYNKIQNIILLFFNIMFQNSFQGNSFFELFDAKNSKDKDKTIYRLSNPNIIRTFDKEMKNYILDLYNSNNKIVFPKEEKQQLYLLQQFLVFQILISANTNFVLEIIISDSVKTKRRLIFSPGNNKIEQKPFFIKFPNDLLPRGLWINLCIDLWSLFKCFKGQVYRSLDQIYITGNFKLRKIFTARHQINQQFYDYDSSPQKLQVTLPKHFFYPINIQHQNILYNYQKFFPQNKNAEIVNNIQPLYNQFGDFSAPKLQLPVRKQSKNGIQNEKRFLSNTNTTELLYKKKEQYLFGSPKKQKYPKEKDDSNKLKLDSNSNKFINQPKHNLDLIKTSTNSYKGSLGMKQIQSSPQKLLKLEKPIKNVESTKINPWRPKNYNQQQESNKKSINKDQRELKSAKTTLLKNKNPIDKRKIIKINQNDKISDIRNQVHKQDNKMSTNQKKNQNYSDSQYFQLSQKFSTITDHKFFKASDQFQRIIEYNQEENDLKKNQEQIEQAIQIETNSMRSSIRRDQNQIENKVEENKKFQQTSHSKGFLQQHFQKFIGDMERPYTPPLNSNESTKQDKKQKQQKRMSIQNKEVQLIYDPVLNCYYDFKTNTYYELKK